MGIGVMLAARFSPGSLLRRRTPSSVLDDVERWWRTHAAALDPVIERTDAPDVFEATIVLHPAAEAVAFEVTEPGVLIVSATTSLVGPGYHRYVVDSLKRMAGDLGLDWVDPATTDELGDETGYFETGDRAAVDLEMLAFGRGLAEAVLEAAEDGATGMVIGMPAADVRYHTDDFLQTMTGPRDRDAVVRMAAGDEEEIRSLNPWWADPTDGAFHLGRATVRMWWDVAWVGAVEDDERPILEAVDADLAAADRAGLATPASGWNEVRALLGRPPARPGVPASGTPIGYRRGPATVTIGDWTVEIPGSWRIGNEDRAFVAFRDGSVRVSTWSRDPDVAADEVAPWDELRLVPGHVVGRVDEPHLRGVFSQRTTEEEGTTLEVVSGFVAFPGQISLATVVIGSAGVDGALAILRSLRPAEPPDDDPTWAPRPLPAWTRDLIAACLGQLAEEPDGGWYAVFAVPGDAGYVQASTLDDGTLHTEAAGVRHEPRMAEPGRLASLLALGWGEASDEDAGNHVRNWPPGSHVGEVAEHLARTLEVVYELGEDRCADVVLGQ